MTRSPTILFLPGHMCDARMWRGVALPHGRWRQEFAELTQGTIAQMSERCLSRYPGPLVPIGFSLGAIAALAMADLAPERITAIGLIGVNAGPDRPSNAVKRPLLQREVLNGHLERVVTDELKPSYFAAINRNNDAMRTLVLDMAAELGPKVFVAQSEALRTRGDYRHILAALGRPTFLACGSEDRLCRPELHQELAASAGDAECHIIEDAGHLLPIERPSVLQERLSTWLTRVEEEITCQTGS